MNGTSRFPFPTWNIILFTIWTVTERFSPTSVFLFLKYIGQLNQRLFLETVPKSLLAFLWTNNAECLSKKVNIPPLPPRDTHHPIRIWQVCTAEGKRQCSVFFCRFFESYLLEVAGNSLPKGNIMHSCKNVTMFQRVFFVVFVAAAVFLVISSVL